MARKKVVEEDKDNVLVKEEQSKKKSGSSRKTDKNLIPFDKRTEEEQREIAVMGGKASAEARRKKKELRELAKSFLMQDAVPEMKANMAKLGFETEDMTNLAAIIARMYSKAVNMGDLNAARTLIEWAGMSPIQQLKENELMSRLEMFTANGDDHLDDESTDVVFYLPDNSREEKDLEGYVEVLDE